MKFKKLIIAIAIICSTAGIAVAQEKKAEEAAWKITFNHPTNTNVYVSSATGKVEPLEMKSGERLTCYGNNL